MLEKTGDTEGLQKASATLKQRQDALKQYCSDNDLSYKPDRTAVVGYNKSVSAKVNAINRRKTVENPLTVKADSAIIKSNEIKKIRNEIIPNMKTSHVVQRQNIHRQGTKMYEDRKAQLLAKGKYGPAYVTISDKEIVDLVNKYKGTGRIRLNKNNRWDNKETIIDNDKIVGVVVNDINGKAVETSVFKIHYGKDGVHVVPDYPSKKGSD